MSNDKELDDLQKEYYRRELAKDDARRRVQSPEFQKQINRGIAKDLTKWALWAFLAFIALTILFGMFVQAISPPSVQRRGSYQPSSSLR
jgi:hypothetical protein